ncbi:hypothetical protein GBF35_23805 [Nonomuraea phyllanthi]|uniref:hypothetical protein n=1 Tax=Nonomuraea phyllanthi TaxID=2219224 RepID=UPI0012938042|nr:hypothetical protein [Nonomuraea phyllanthi]QFY09281.1 hypothetical protein GBF35_23805 [Nonomuraea phyllanthi]
MPVFFLVSGYANAVSPASERRRGGDVAGWLLSRSGRLLRPTTALALVAAGGALIAHLAGAAALHHLRTRPPPGTNRRGHEPPVRS